MAIATAHGEFAGYGSIFNITDLGDDVVLPGAFVNLRDFVSTGTFNWSHDSAWPIAIPLEARDDGIGLWIRGAFHSTARAQEVRTIAEERQKAGNPLGLSIGYVTLESRGQGSVRLLSKLYLLEVSLVTLPMNHRARVQAVKYTPADAPRVTGGRVSAAEIEALRARGLGVRIP